MRHRFSPAPAVAPVLAFCAAALGPTVTRDDATRVRYAESCADGGSCAPNSDYICEVNGVHYAGKYYFQSDE